MSTAALSGHTIDVVLLGRRGRYSLTPVLQFYYLTLVNFYDTHQRMPSLSEWGDQPRISGFKARLWEAREELEARGWITTKRTGGRVDAYGIEFLEPVLRDLQPVSVPPLSLWWRSSK